jgi:ABC-type glutathione transport system ATPase component
MMSMDTPQSGDEQASNGPLADFHERLKAERLKPENVDDVDLTIIGIIVQLRLKGASIRAIAGCLGCSKSTMHRLILQIEQPSQMGQDISESAANTGLPKSDLSQMGQVSALPEAAE